MGQADQVIDWYLDHPTGPSTVRFRRRRAIRVAEKRERWRITLDELCYAAKITPRMFQEWAEYGYLGGRPQSLPSQGGRGRHITRETAQKTVIVARLVHCGVLPSVAAHVAAGHKVGDTSPLSAEIRSGVTITVHREALP